MKEKKIIIVLIVLIIIVITIDLSLIIYKNTTGNKLNQPENKEEVKKLVIYKCTKEKVKTMGNNQNYMLSINYEFDVLEDKINQGKYEETLKFDSLENYNWYRSNQEVDTIFEKEYDIENFTLKYKQNMILKDKTITDSTTIEDYLNYLDKKEIHCAKTKDGFVQENY